MSTNAKNIIRPEFLKNFTKKVKERYVLLEKGNKEFSNISELVASVNQITNEIVQELNLRITDRQLPYITLKICYGNIINERVRVFLHNDDTDFFYEKDIKALIEAEKEITHVLDLLIASSLKKITISMLSCDAELIIDYKLLKSAIIDILLDIVMFNSYSFLKSLNLSERKELNINKHNFFKKHYLPCFYDCPENKLLYYSLSFSARKNKDDFDIDKFIQYWDAFINEYYSYGIHEEKSIKKQIEQHKDVEELPKNLHKRFDNLPDGSYLILRTNKDRTEDIHPMLFSLFGINKYKKGKIKIVPIEEFEKYKPLMANLDVSAFKIVKKTKK